MAKFAAGVVDTVGKFAAGIVDTGGNFAASVIDSGGKYATDVVDTCAAPGLVNISANFQKNLKWPYCYFQQLGGRWFMKKTPEAKNLMTLSL